MLFETSDKNLGQNLQKGLTQQNWQFVLRRLKERPPPTSRFKRLQFWTIEKSLTIEENFIFAKKFDSGPQGKHCKKFITYKGEVNFMLKKFD